MREILRNINIFSTIMTHLYVGAKESVKQRFVMIGIVNFITFGGGELMNSIESNDRCVSDDLLPISLVINSSSFPFAC